jgi:hypothetical protein
MSSRDNCTLRVAGLIAAAAFAAACTDTSSPTGLATSSIQIHNDAAAASHRPTRFANSVKYRDQGLKPARGRSGNATLEARAILGFDGLTTLDVSTGVIDAASASGTLKKIQIQQLGPDGTPQNTTNYNIGT